MLTRTHVVDSDLYIDHSLGCPAPEIKCQTLDGMEARLSALKGKVVVLEFGSFLLCLLLEFRLEAESGNNETASRRNSNKARPVHKPSDPARARTGSTNLARPAQPGSRPSIGLYLIDRNP